MNKEFDPNKPAPSDPKTESAPAEPPQETSTKSDLWGWQGPGPVDYSEEMGYLERANYQPYDDD